MSIVRARDGILTMADGTVTVLDEPMPEGPLVPRMPRCAVSTMIEVPAGVRWVTPDTTPNPHHADLTAMLEGRWAEHVARDTRDRVGFFREPTDEERARWAAVDAARAVEAAEHHARESARIASLRTIRVRLTAEALVQVPMEWDEAMIAAAVRGHWLGGTEARGVEVTEEAPEDDTGAIELDEHDVSEGGA